MNTIYVDPSFDDDLRRDELYRGQLVVYGATTHSLALIDLAKALIREAFGSRDPERAQHEMPVEEYAAVLAALKPKFIHHPESKECIRGILRDLGCDLDKTYFEVPRLRTATSDNYLTTGIAYAFHPHRDTWYGAPQCQLNFWLPVFDIESNRAMAFHPRYWSAGVRNGSHAFNYSEWTGSRFNGAPHLKQESRVQPHADVELELEPQIRVVTPVGGLLVFSAAQMHSTVPNDTGLTRFSIDFRTVHLDDVTSFRGAPNVDSACTGTSLVDFERASDRAPVPAELVALYETEKTSGAAR